ncbi:metallophosphoesterase, partial [Candidatus Woesearchaeota archaeon]|nr:metallophosphoesterase [Candidatus Woesearchaeota archaeon]
MAVLKDTVKKGIKGRFRLEDIAQKDANTTRVITLSDTHKLTIELVRGAVDLARKTNADAILIAGDFVDGGRFYEILEDKGYNKEVYRQWDTLIHQIFNSTPGDGSEEIFKNYFEVNGMNARQIEAFKRNFAVHHHIKQEIGRLFEIECMEKTAYMCKELEQKPENCKIGIILGNHEPTSCLNPLVIPQEWIIPCNGINEDQGVLQINDHFQVIGHVGSSERYAGLPDHMYSHLSSVREGRHYREALLRWKAKMGEGKLEDLRREMLKEDKTYDRLKKHLKKGTILVTHKSSSPNGANEEKHPDSMDVDWGAYNAVTEAVEDTDN